MHMKWQTLLGVTLEEGTGATMSDDDDELQLDCPLDMSVDGHDMMGFGPLLPTESERSLMERVRQELKIELKQVFSFSIALETPQIIAFDPPSMSFPRICFIW